METPSLKLAKQTMDRLVTEQLITPKEAEKFAQKFSEGRVKAEDWRLAVENAIEKKPEL